MGSSHKRGRKGRQQRLTFEAVAEGTGDGDAAASSSSLPGVGLSPARIRLSSPGGGGSGSPSRRAAVRMSSAVQTGPRAKGKKGKQQTLEATLGQQMLKTTPKKQRTVMVDDDEDELATLPVGRDIASRQRAVPTPPRSSFMKSKKSGRHVRVQDSDSETPVEEDGAVSDSSGEGPLKQETPRQTQTRRTMSVPGESDSDDDDDELAENDESKPAREFRSSQSLPNQAAPADDSEEDPLVTPRSSMPRRKGRRIITLDDEDESVDDESVDDESVDDDEERETQTPAKRRKITKHRAVSVPSESSEEESDVAPVQHKKRMRLKNRGSSPGSTEARSRRSTAEKTHRTEKEKRMELLRRRRAGEKDLTLDDLTPSADEGEGALYDTDEELQALDVFDDESESEEEAPPKKKSKKKAKERRTAREPSPLGDGADSDDENFIDDDDDTLGVPDEALHLMPLEFTRASRKPLKQHFKDAVEWLVHRRINPGFDRDNEMYLTAWRRLSDEVTGLANSKFISSVWRPDFYKALKARPYIEQLQLAPSHLATDMSHCQACGRSGHPATWTIQFKGKPYDPKTLDEVESDSEDEDSEEGIERDYDGTVIPPENREFYLGQTCNSNAETAHGLTHWKASLRDWVDARLEGEGLMAPERVVERERMKARKRQRLADGIVQGWDDGDVVKNLFLDFKATIENARNKDTTKTSRGARR